MDGKSIYLNSLFLYRLDSSTLPPDRAYPQVSDWSISDPLDTRYDKFTGQWAVYAARDLIKDGETLAERGERIAGSDFDASRFGGELFELATDERGVVTVRATELMLGLVSADTEHEQAWTAFIQCQRIAVGGPVANRFTETINGVERPSNTVTTHTPDMTPRLTISSSHSSAPAQPPQSASPAPTAATPGTRTTRMMMALALMAVPMEMAPSRTSPNSSPQSTPRSRP
nr:LPXTG cell wall anchor domain-containing protein [Bifidobacterium catenulatum]